MNRKTKILRTVVMNYFRYIKQCPVVTCEQGIGRYDRMHRPDVLVVDSKRHLIEIEIKTSLADFRNDKKKRIWKYREKYPEIMPYKFYYCVSDDISDVVKDELKDSNFGLLSARCDIDITNINWWCCNIIVTKKAKAFKVPRLSFKDIILMVKNQSSTLCRMSLEVLKNEGIQ